MLYFDSGCKHVRRVSSGTLVAPYRDTCRWHHTPDEWTQGSPMFLTAPTPIIHVAIGTRGDGW